MYLNIFKIYFSVSYFWPVLQVQRGPPKNGKIFLGTIEEKPRQSHYFQEQLQVKDLYAVEMGLHTRGCAGVPWKRTCFALASLGPAGYTYCTISFNSCVTRHRTQNIRKFSYLSRVTKGILECAKEVTKWLKNAQKKPILLRGVA
jgi:hypothetical protein